jgi:ATP-dependent helicase/nuclease subunit B
LEGLARLNAEDGRGEDDADPGFRDRAARRLGAMRALAGLIQPLIDSTPAWNARAENAVAAALVLMRESARTASALDGLARDRLLQEIRSMDQALASGGAPPGFDAWEWLAELPDRLRVAGSAPRPGCLHVAPLTTGGHTGRPCTFIVGLDDSRFPSAGHQDPLVLDVERRQLGGELALSGDRLRRQMEEFARLVCRLRGRVTLSHSNRNLDDDSEAFASPVVLSAWRIISGERRGDHSALKRALPPAESFAPRSPGECLDGGEWWLWCSSREPPVGNLADLAEGSFPHLERGRAAAAARASDAFTRFDGLVENPGPELDPRRPEGPVLSATGKLKTLGECPLRYFYKEVLHVRPPEDVDVDPECWLSHLDYGTLMHEVFFDFVSELIAAGHWPPEPTRDLPVMTRIVEARAAQWLKKVPPPNAEAYQRQRRELRSAAEIFINEQSGLRHTARPAIPAYLEAALGTRSGPRRSGIDQAEPVPVALPNGATIRCNGRIDRIDRRVDGNPDGPPTFLVMDYKSGRSAFRFDPSDLYDQGRLVQHALYLEIAQTVLREHFGPKASVDEFMFFFPSTALQGRTVEYGREIIPGGKRVIERLCALAGAGAFVATDTDKDCTWCDYRKACQAVSPDLEAYCGQAAAKLANDKNRAIAPFAELRIDR